MDYVDNWIMWYEKYVVPTSYEKIRITKEMKKETRRRVERSRIVGVKLYWIKKKCGDFQKDDNDDDSTAVKAAVMSSPVTENLLVRMTKDLKKIASSSSSSSSPEEVVEEQEKDGGKEKLEKELGEDEGDTAAAITTSPEDGLSKEEVDREWVTDKPPWYPYSTPSLTSTSYTDESMETEINEDGDVVVKDNFGGGERQRMGEGKSMETEIDEDGDVVVKDNFGGGERHRMGEN